MVFFKPLGTVPNRGSGSQGDVFLNGLSYVQTVHDVTNVTTGKADAEPTEIHFEPGLWMHCPATTNPPHKETLSRMASIPHGTTINAQCLHPTSASGGPKFSFVSITSFGIHDLELEVFPSQTVTDENTARIPQVLTKFIGEGTITQEILNDPTTVLIKAIENQNIIETTTFTVKTESEEEVLGGGVQNIAFLKGAPHPESEGGGPNAFVPKMQTTYWVETVSSELVFPPYTHMHGNQTPTPVSLSPKPTGSGARGRVPSFLVDPPQSSTTEATTIPVKWTQIQYCQTVLLNFSGLSWPHVSVATLVPTTEQAVSFSGN